MPDHTLAALERAVLNNPADEVSLSALRDRLMDAAARDALDFLSRWATRLHQQSVLARQEQWLGPPRFAVESFVKNHLLNQAHEQRSWRQITIARADYRSWTVRCDCLQRTQVAYYNVDSDRPYSRRQELIQMQSLDLIEANRHYRYWAGECPECLTIYWASAEVGLVSPLHTGR